MVELAVSTALDTVDLLPKTTAPSKPVPTVTLLPITITLDELTVLLLPITRMPVVEAVGKALLLPNAPDSVAATGAAAVPLLLPMVYVPAPLT